MASSNKKSPVRDAEASRKLLRCLFQFALAGDYECSSRNTLCHSCRSPQKGWMILQTSRLGMSNVSAHVCRDHYKTRMFRQIQRFQNLSSFCLSSLHACEIKSVIDRSNFLPRHAFFD